MSADDQSDEGSALSASKLAELATKAKLAGKQAAIPVLQDVIRDEVVRLLREHDPARLRGFMDVEYRLVHEELPEGYRNALGSVGPQFEEQLLQVVTPEQIMAWLEHPEEWMGDDVDAETKGEVRRVARIIRDHPGGERWMEEQVLDFYAICNIV